MNIPKTLIVAHGRFTKELTFLAKTKAGVIIYVDTGNHVFIHCFHIEKNNLIPPNDMKVFKSEDEADDYIQENAEETLKVIAQRRKMRESKELRKL